MQAQQQCKFVVIRVCMQVHHGILPGQEAVGPSDSSLIIRTMLCYLLQYSVTMGSCDGYSSTTDSGTWLHVVMWIC